MKFNSLKEALQFRINESEENYWIEDFWKELSEIAVSDLDKAIQYIQTSCTDEEFYWLTEIVGDIVSIKPNRALITALRERLGKVVREIYSQESFCNEYMRQNIDYDTYIKQVAYDIDFAEGIIDMSEN